MLIGARRECIRRGHSDGSRVLESPVIGQVLGFRFQGCTSAVSAAATLRKSDRKLDAERKP